MEQLLEVMGRIKDEVLYRLLLEPTRFIYEPGKALVDVVGDDSVQLRSEHDGLHRDAVLLLEGAKLGQGNLASLPAELPP